MALNNKVIVTSSEEQMKEMLRGGGKIAGSNGHKGALLVLTAEKTLLQAGMNSAALWATMASRVGTRTSCAIPSRSRFSSLRQTRSLPLEVQLTTREPDMAQSLASVVRGLISLVSFSDDMDAEAIAVLQGTSVDSEG